MIWRKRARYYNAPNQWLQEAPRLTRDIEPVVLLKL